MHGAAPAGIPADAVDEPTKQTLLFESSADLRWGILFIIPAYTDSRPGRAFWSIRHNYNNKNHTDRPACQSFRAPGAVHDGGVKTDVMIYLVSEHVEQTPSNKRNTN
ncbi:hypothetical protein MN608_03639 [Microdochium nivale]|nr:hypothetical protein MN608_03639 [Microdochium nivale]